MNKHDRPNLPWAGFLGENETKDAELLGGQDLEAIKMDGHFFQEVVMYHKPTKSLVGMTDMAISNDYVFGFKNPHGTSAPYWAHLYAFGMGIWRGPLSKPLEVQSYFYPFTLDRVKLRASVDRLKTLDIQHLVLGHGYGQWSGPQAKQAIVGAYEWLYTPDWELTFIEKMYLPMRWLNMTGLAGPTLQLLGKRATGQLPPLPDPSD